MHPKNIKYDNIKSISEITQAAKNLFPIIERNQYLQKQNNSIQIHRKKEDIKLPYLERNQSAPKKKVPLKLNKSSELYELSSLSAKNYHYKKPVFRINFNFLI